MGSYIFNKKVKIILFAILSACLLIGGSMFLSACRQAEMYSILLLDEDNATVLYAAKVEDGEVITGVPTPDKEADAQYTYTFSGWVDEDGNKVVLSFATGNVTACATYTKTLREYSLSISANGQEVSSFEQVEIACGNRYLTTGAALHYGDILQITVNSSDGYEIYGNINYTGLDKVIEDGAIYYVVTGDVTISYAEVAATYTVKFMDDTGAELYSAAASYGDSVDYPYATPAKQADSKYTYTFAGWADSSGTIVSTTLRIADIDKNMALYAVFNGELIAYSLDVSDGLEVLLNDGTTVTADNAPTVVIYYGDTFTVCGYTMPDGYSFNSIAYENATLSQDIYTVCGDVTLTLLIQKTFFAEEYSGVQKFDAFTDSSGTACISAEDCTYTDGFVFGTYVGEGETDLTATYRDFIAMSAVGYQVTGTITADGTASAHTYDTAHSVNYNSATYTWNGYASGNQEQYQYTDYITTPLYKGMTVEFELTYDSNAITLGIMSEDELKNPASFLWKTSYTSYANVTFCPAYNIFSNKAQTYLSNIVANSGTITAISAAAPSFYQSAANYDETVTIRFVLGDYVTVVVSDANNTYTLEMTGWVISSGTAYYFSVMANSGTTVKFTQFGYYGLTERMADAYVATLSGLTLTTFGDSITKGSGATDADGNSDKSYSYSKLLAAALGMTENNQGISGAVYCSGSSLTCQTENIDTIPLDSRIVVVYLGVNDFKTATDSWATLTGSFDPLNTDTTTIWGALNVAYMTLYEMFYDTDTDIYICTPSPTEAVASGAVTVNSSGWTMAQLAGAITTVAAYYGFEVIDLYSGIDWQAHTDSSGETWFYDDMGHPNSTGHKHIADYIYSCIIRANLEEFILSTYGY